MPARISSIGLIILLTFSAAYSAKNIAVIRPIGKATKAAMTVTIKVPDTRGKTPYERGFSIGVHLVPVRNSQIPISLKNPYPWYSKITRIPNVVSIDTNAHDINSHLTIDPSSFTQNFFLESTSPDNLITVPSGRVF